MTNQPDDKNPQTLTWDEVMGSESASPDAHAAAEPTPPGFPSVAEAADQASSARAADLMRQMATARRAAAHARQQGEHAGEHARMVEVTSLGKQLEGCPYVETDETRNAYLDLTLAHAEQCEGRAAEARLGGDTVAFDFHKGTASIVRGIATVFHPTEKAAIAAARGRASDA